MVWGPFMEMIHFAPRSISAKETNGQLPIVGMASPSISNSPLLLKGRTRTTTLIFPAPPGAIFALYPMHRGWLSTMDVYGDRSAEVGCK
jgi:hypothetical protein